MTANDIRNVTEYFSRISVRPLNLNAPNELPNRCENEKILYSMPNYLFEYDSPTKR